jgi:DNA primase
MPRKRRIYRYYDVLRGLRKKKFNSVVITEGTISAIRAGLNAVATYGKYVSPEQVEMLASLQTKADAGPISYIVALDGDALSYSMKLARRLFARGLQTSVVMLPDGHDPASLPKEEWLRLRDSALPYNGLLSEAMVGLARA